MTLSKALGKQFVMAIWVQAIAESYKMVGFLLFINQPVNSLKKKNPNDSA